MALTLIGITQRMMQLPGHTDYPRKDMFLSKPCMILLSALAAALVGSLGMAPLPASAAAAHPAEISGKGAILCSGDLCIQNNGYTSNAVVIAAWADTTNFYGHIDMAEGSYLLHYPAVGNQWFYAGGKAAVFLMPIQCTYSYIGTAWRFTGGHYYNNGQVKFGLSICSRPAAPRLRR